MVTRNAKVEKPIVHQTEIFEDWNEKTNVLVIQHGEDLQLHPQNNFANNDTEDSIIFLVSKVPIANVTNLN